MHKCIWMHTSLCCVSPLLQYTYIYIYVYIYMYTHIYTDIRIMCACILWLVCVCVCACDIPTLYARSFGFPWVIPLAPFLSFFLSFFLSIVCIFHMSYKSNAVTVAISSNSLLCGLRSCARNCWRKKIYAAVFSSSRSTSYCIPTHMYLPTYMYIPIYMYERPTSQRDHTRQNVLLLAKGWSWKSRKECFPVCCSGTPLCVAVHYSGLQLYKSLCCNALQCVAAVHLSVLQCITVCCSGTSLCVAVHSSACFSFNSTRLTYGVATISRLLKIIGPFAEYRSLL